ALSHVASGRIEDETELDETLGRRVRNSRQRHQSSAANGQGQGLQGGRVLDRAASDVKRRANVGWVGRRPEVETEQVGPGSQDVPATDNATCRGRVEARGVVREPNEGIPLGGSDRANRN